MSDIQAVLTELRQLRNARRARIKEMDAARKPLPPPRIGLGPLIDAEREAKIDRECVEQLDSKLLAISKGLENHIRDRLKQIKQCGPDEIMYTFDHARVRYEKICTLDGYKAILVKVKELGIKVRLSRSRAFPNSSAVIDIDY